MSQAPSALISLLSGIFAPTITGYHADGSINAEGTKTFVRFLLENGVDGLAPLGSAGEPVALTLPERMRLLEAIVEETNGQVPIFAGTGDYSTASTIEISLLAQEDVVHAVKWSHLEVSRIHDTRLLCGPDFPIFAGIDVIAFEAMAVGANGWISGLPMMVPGLARKLHRLLVCEKNLDAARELWYRLLPLIHLEYRALGVDHGNPHWLAVCRESAVLRGIPVGISRGPLSAVDPSVREELRSILMRLWQL